MRSPMHRPRMSPGCALRSRTAALDDLPQITRAIESTGGLEYTARLARREKDLAIEALGRLPESAYRKALGALAEFAVARTY